MKIAMVLRADLKGWQALNVTAFLASGIAAGVPGLIGESYEDASGNTYLPLFGLPVVVYAADDLSATHRAALDRELATAVYTEGMFATGNDVDNRAVVRALPRDGLGLVGLGICGSRSAVDKTCKGLQLHP